MTSHPEYKLIISRSYLFGYIFLGHAMPVFFHLKELTPLPYLRHSDAFNFDINLEVGIKSKCSSLICKWVWSFELHHCS